MAGGNMLSLWLAADGVRSVEVNDSSVVLRNPIIDHPQFYGGINFINHQHIMGAL